MSDNRRCNICSIDLDSLCIYEVRQEGSSRSSPVCLRCVPSFILGLRVAMVNFDITPDIHQQDEVSVIAIKGMMTMDSKRSKMQVIDDFAELLKKEIWA